MVGEHRDFAEPVNVMVLYHLFVKDLEDTLYKSLWIYFHNFFVLVFYNSRFVKCAIYLEPRGYTLIIIIIAIVITNNYSYYMLLSNK